MIVTTLPQGAPQPIGHYCHAVELPNGLVFLSGQKAWDIQTGQLIDGDIEAQTHLIFDILSNVLTGIGLSLNNIARIQCHLSGGNLYERFNRVYAQRLGEHRPARAVLAGYELRGGALVELVAEAFRPRAQ
jgi:2-iminobutanoate/2-iminopropanoate deaminase